MDIEQLPKLDLHCHLDGSLTKSMIERHLGKEVAREALSVSQDCKSLTEYLEKFDLPSSVPSGREGPGRRSLYFCGRDRKRKGRVY